MEAGTAGIFSRTRLSPGRMTAGEAFFSWAANGSEETRRAKIKNSFFTIGLLSMRAQEA
jgi:hypothetical protein